jgi:hypothetical protein
MNIPNGWGQWDECSTGLQKSVWYKIKYYCKVNTGTNANGILRGWVNDAQVAEHTAYRFDLTTNKDFPLGRIWFNFYHGGSLTPTQDIHAFVTDVRVWVP